MGFPSRNREAVERFPYTDSEKYNPVGAGFHARPFRTNYHSVVLNEVKNLRFIITAKLLILQRTGTKILRYAQDDIALLCASIMGRGRVSHHEIGRRWNASPARLAHSPVNPVNGTDRSVIYKIKNSHGICRGCNSLFSFTESYLITILPLPYVVP